MPGAVRHPRSLAGTDGLSERAKYEIDKRTQAEIERAKYFSKWVGPEVVVYGGGQGKGGSALGDVLMLEKYMEIADKKFRKTGTK